ncbi:MAG: chemotaxis-specific protein-glutamate methyltransferase CheB [Candidatus Hydrogenedentes bacterium]|nr:chemotaxis-specific protein-glutamate methyltransferase CheB [Candidatus Hydrogenedentota bacterium]
MTRVVIVDDSVVVCELLSYILGAAADVEVVGAFNRGQDAIEALDRLRPDLVTMDINMPGMNGFEVTRRIMESNPLPIVIVSGSWDCNEVATTFRALEAGALAVVARPPGIGHQEHHHAAQQLVQTVQAMSGVRVVRRWPVAAARPLEEAVGVSSQKIDLVAIGASTGGPVVIQALLKSLPPKFAVPVIIVQHMAAGFIQGFAEWLGESCNRPVLVGGNHVRLVSAHAYIAPDGHQMGVDAQGRMTLSSGPPINGFAPSVGHLFRSVAESYGPRSAGVLLTGMGRDGAAELKLMRDAGAVTFAQDRESSIIHGMPGEAIRLGAAQYVLPPEKIAAALAAVSK